MPTGFGRGFARGGWGFGFRGSSPPWPYIGLGRGGLPRCGYFLSGAGRVPGWPIYGYSPYYAAPPMPFYGAPYSRPGAGPYAPQMTRDEELDFLRDQAEAIKQELERIDARINELKKE
ncbi:MAG: DUF5320 domain-containing protein [Dehalococcoidia bacterium]